jgi:hypothetical protein
MNMNDPVVQQDEIISKYGVSVETAAKILFYRTMIDVGMYDFATFEIKYHGVFPDDNTVTVTPTLHLKNANHAV